MGAINHTHVFLSSRPQKNLTPIFFDFLNRKNSIVCFCKQCTILKGFFGMSMHNNLVEYM